MKSEAISDLRRLSDERIDWQLSALTRSAHTADICPRSVPGDRHLSGSSVCDRPVAGDHRRHGDHFQKPDLSRVDVDCPCCQYRRRLPTVYYPVPFHLHILAGAWLIIAGTLGMV